MFVSAIFFNRVIVVISGLDCWNHELQMISSSMLATMYAMMQSNFFGRENTEKVKNYQIQK